MSEINDLHKNMISLTKAHFADSVQTVEDYPRKINGKIDTPAILFEVESGAYTENQGDDRVPITLQITAHCILSHEKKNVGRETVAFAAEMLRFVNCNYWNLNDKVLKPERIEIGLDEFKPGRHGYESWYCTWEQTVYLGESSWDSFGFMPSTVYMGYDGDDEQVV